MEVVVVGFFIVGVDVRGGFLIDIGVGVKLLEIFEGKEVIGILRGFMSLFFG